MKQAVLSLTILAALNTATAAATTETAPSSTTGAERNSPQQAHQLDEVQVYALPIKQGADDVIAPVSVLAGAALDDAKAGTLGETVAKQPGVQTTYFGPGVGRPVIRGLDGPRVGVLSNGVSSGDVSSVSQDHAVSIEPFLADQIEVLKGPATLLYGSGAIGGVVNVVDGRVPDRLPDRPFSGRAELRGNDAANERTGMARLDLSSGQFVLHADGAYRDTDDYDGPDGKIENSFLTTKSGSIGGAWIGDRGFLGLAVSRFLNHYGNPAEPGDAAEDEAAVTLQLQQTRYDLKGGLNLDAGAIEAVRISTSHTDYRHTEFEGDEIGTVFLSQSNESRVEFVQREVAGWRGAFGLQFLHRDFRAIGEEAFVPPSQTRSYGLFGMEQREWDRLKLDLGARIDRHVSDPSDGAKRSFSPLSLSAGAAFRLAEGWHLNLNLDRAQRAPAEEELFANGPHVATESFEVGLPQANKETSHQVELGLHFHSDFVDAKVSGYVNRFSDYIYLADTGEIQDELPLRQWSQADARFHGFEGEALFKLSEGATGHYDLRVWGDTVRASLDSGGNLPRMAPARFGADLKWSAQAWRASAGVTRYLAQDRPAPFETATDGFTLVNAHLSYTIDSSDNTSWELFADGSNLTNQTARLSTSYIKDKAPLPGRTLAFGVRAFF
ncbi:MAG: TonB-dependent receptor [Rhodanobacteraceae bacterium]|nr:TonB-dependent receptor [Rhodanobacteraceae bacterium]